jgi:FtsZ-interacting cell division protein ZipA
MAANDVILLVFGIVALIGIGITLHGWHASRRDRERGYHRRDRQDGST